MYSELPVIPGGLSFDGEDLNLKNISVWLFLFSLNTIIVLMFREKTIGISQCGFLTRYKSLKSFYLKYIVKMGWVIFIETVFVGAINYMVEKDFKIIYLVGYMIVFISSWLRGIVFMKIPTGIRGEYIYVISLLVEIVAIYSDRICSVMNYMMLPNYTMLNRYMSLFGKG